MANCRHKLFNTEISDNFDVLNWSKYETLNSHASLPSIKKIILRFIELMRDPFFRAFLTLAICFRWSDTV